MIIESLEKCEICDEISFLREFDSSRCECRFYISPYLDLKKVLHVLKIREEYEENYGMRYHVTCPTCGEEGYEYGVPDDDPSDGRCSEFRVYVPENTDIVSIPIEEIEKLAPEATIYRSDNKKEEVSESA